MVYSALAMTRRKDDWAKNYAPVGNESGSRSNLSEMRRQTAIIFAIGTAATAVIIYYFDLERSNLIDWWPVAIALLVIVVYYVCLERDLKESIKMWDESVRSRAKMQDEIDRSKAK